MEALLQEIKTLAIQMFDWSDPKIMIAQLIGVAAAILSFCGYQGKNSHRIFLFQIITNAVWAVHLYLMGATTGVILNVMGFIRSIFLYFDDKKWANSKWSVIGVTALMALSGLVTWGGEWPGVFSGSASWSGWLSLLPTLAMTIGTPLLWTRRDKAVRLAQLCAISPLWLIYNFAMKSVPGTVTECLNIISVIIALIRYRKNRQSEENA